MNNTTMTSKEFANRLTDALKRAEEIATSVSRSVPDGGTCNLDSVILWPGKFRKPTIEAAAKAAGVGIVDSRWLGKRCFHLCFSVYGQGEARTKGVEAARSFLTDQGFDVSVYYAMD